jgi:hypothetical protein
LSLEGSDQAGIIAVGAGALLVLAGAIFKAANLRGDSNSKWSSRIDLAVVALDEKTVVELRELREEIETVLPDAHTPFDPTRNVSVNPAPLSERVERTAKYYTARMRMSNDLDRVRRLGRVFVFSLALLMIAVVLLTVHYAEVLDWAWTRWAGFGAGGLAVVILVAAGVVYGVCVDRLASGEILADTASRAGAGGDA